MNSSFLISDSTTDTSSSYLDINFPTIEAREELFSELSPNNVVGTEEEISFHKNSASKLKKDENSELSNEKNSNDKSKLLKLNFKVISNEIANDNTTTFDGKQTRYIVVKPENPKLEKRTLDLLTESNDSTVKKDFDFPCLTCGVIATKDLTAECHKLAHVTGHKCSFCPQAFFKKHTAEMHKRLHRGGEVKHADDFGQCKICGGSFISLMYLEFHIYESHGADILEDSKAMHLGTSHVDEIGEPKLIDIENKKKFRCGTCNCLFAHSLNLDCHMEFHKESIYACGMCNSSFTLLDDLLAHSHIHNNKTFNNLFESYVTCFETTSAFNKSFTEQNNFEQVLEIQAKTESTEHYELDDFDIEDMINDVQTDFKGKKSTKNERNKPQWKVLSNEPNHPKRLAIYNKKFVSQKTSHDSQTRLTNPFFTSSMKNSKDFLQTDESCFETSYVNPYLYHFMPNGKNSKYVHNIN